MVVVVITGTRRLAATSRGTFHVNLHSVRMLHVLHQTPCGVQARFARGTHVIARFTVCRIGLGIGHLRSTLLTRALLLPTGRGIHPLLFNTGLDVVLILDGRRERRRGSTMFGCG